MQFRAYTQSGWCLVCPKNKEKVGGFIKMRNVAHIVFPESSLALVKFWGVGKLQLMNDGGE